MDIKLIRNTEDAVFKPINNGLVLQMVDDNYKFLDFIGKKLYILNSITNERYEISPEIKKYNIASGTDYRQQGRYIAVQIFI